MSAVALLLLLMGCMRSPTQTPQALPSPHPLVEINVKDLSGNPVSLEQYRGQVVLVNFWASWCSPCIEELPLLNAYNQAHKDNGFVLIGVNVSEDAEYAAKFITENGFDFTVWSDPLGDTMIQLRIRALPFSLLIDREGRLLNHWLGPLSKQILEENVTPLLESSGG